MHSAVLEMAIRWLAEPEPEALCLGPRCTTLPRTTAPFDEGVGDGWMEMLDLDLGMHLCRVVHHFAPGAGGLRPMSAVHAALTEPIKSILEAALTDALTGGLRRLHAQARVLDFLVALAGHLHTLPNPAASRRARLERVREELDQLHGQVPNLGELARRHGFSARALNQDFKQAYGRTVYAYVTDLRLDAAHALLRTSHPPLKVVAARLGYASVSHFSRAFTDKFGVRPGSIRPRH